MNKKTSVKDPFLPKSEYVLSKEETLNIIDKLLEEAEN